MFVLIILGSDKTTVSNATGNNEYWPIYSSIGNIHNNMRRAHGSGFILIGFLAIAKGTSTPTRSFSPKYVKKIAIAADKIESNSAIFCTFRRQLFHSSLSQILSTLRSGMTKPEVTRCSDGHFHCIIWGLGPYITDYPEQTLLSCIVQYWCPR